jgi:hypothetical protein
MEIIDLCYDCHGVCMDDGISHGRRTKRIFLLI